jgi:hypothetical protein
MIIESEHVNGHSGNAVLDAIGLLPEKTLADPRSLEGGAALMSNPSPGPVPSPDLSRDDPEHPGFVVHGEDNTPGHKPYYIHLEAKEGQEDARRRSSRILTQVSIRSR